MRDPNTIQSEIDDINARMKTLGLLDNRVPAESLMTTLPEEPARPLVKGLVPYQLRSTAHSVTFDIRKLR